MRLTVDITPEEHQRIKTVASLQGKSIKAYVMERVLPELAPDEAHALNQLEKLLQKRIKASAKERLTPVTVKQLFATVLKGMS